MKKIFVLLITCILFSCSLDDGDETQVSYEFLPIESVDIPSEFELNENYEITLTYFRPTDCHAFNNVFFERNEDSRTVAVVAAKYITKENTCDTINTEHETTFNLLAAQRENYLFKFWQGVDDQGENLYLEIEVPVIN